MAIRSPGGIHQGDRPFEGPAVAVRSLDDPRINGGADQKRVRRAVVVARPQIRAERARALPRRSRRLCLAVEPLRQRVPGRKPALGVELANAAGRGQALANVGPAATRMPGRPQPLGVEQGMKTMVMACA